MNQLHEMTKKPATCSSCGLLDRMKRVTAVLSAALLTVQKGGLLSFGVLLSLWTASNAVMAFQTALNDAYDMEEQRPYWKLRILSVLLVICFTCFILASLLLLFFGPRIGPWIASLASLGKPFTIIWNTLRWPVILVLMMAALSALDRYAPSIKLSWRETLQALCIELVATKVPEYLAIAVRVGGPATHAGVARSHLRPETCPHQPLVPAAAFLRNGAARLLLACVCFCR